MSDGARVMAGILCLLVFCSPIPVAAQSVPQSGISGVSIAGDGVIDATETGNNTTYLWQSEPVNVSVTVADYPNAVSYGICLGYTREGAPAKALGKCEPLPLTNGTTGTAEFENVTWPANMTGEQKLVIEVRKRSFQNNVTLLDRKTIPVTILQKQSDFDSDGLTNAKEIEAGYNISNSDMDADGLADGTEVNEYKTNPQDPDTDGDGVRDAEEIQHGTNASAADTDSDGLSDSIELRLGTDPENSWTPVLIVVFVVLVGGVIVLGGRRLRRGLHERFGESEVERNGGTEPVTTDHEGNGAQEPAPEPTPEPLTDEDRVLGLLREHGGRMKQSHIVEETEWSKAKVSRLLSAMNDDGDIEKLTIGRENVISLDGHGPDAGDSSHDERSDASS